MRSLLYQQKPWPAAKRRAYTINCTSNLHQVGMAIQMFADDHSDVVPNGDNGINTGRGMSIAQVASYSASDADPNDWLVYSIQPYVAAPPPSTTLTFNVVTNVIKILFCPANLRYNPKVAGGVIAGFRLLRDGRGQHSRQRQPLLRSPLGSLWLQWRGRGFLTVSAP